MRPRCQSLLKHADIAIYGANGTGRSARVFANEVMEISMMEDLSLEVALSKALAQRVPGDVPVHHGCLFR